ncbi:MAG: sulfur carrier protein ThiS [Muribaculaceae bacterium]|nr:sulfur carrier protein ThiS [Muribaculaceae bacterium]
MYSYLKAMVMKIYINNSEIEPSAGCATVLDVLRQQGLDTDGVAVGIGGRVLPRSQWSETPLAEGMRITVIRAVCGG